MKRVQHGKSKTFKNCHSEIWQKCKRIVYYSAQTDGPLYAGYPIGGNY